MALVPYTGFIGGAYRARATNFDAEECLNLYPETAQVGTAKSVAALYGTPGLIRWAQLSGGAIRGMLRFNATTAFVAAGANVFRVAPDQSAVLIGTILPDTKLASMASNGVTVVIASGGGLFIIDPVTNSVTPIADADFLGAGQVGFIGGYYVWNVPGTGKSQTSDLYSTDVSPLAFFTAEGSPDVGVGIIVDHLEYWYFGESTVEVFGVVGDADQPLQRINGAFIEHGCAAAYSVAKMDNTIYWLGSDDNGFGIVWRATGAYEPQRVSTHAVEYALGLAGDLSDAVAWTYQQEGHAFYVLSVGDRTWCFDASTGLWHQRAWKDANGGLHRHRAQCHMTFAGKNLVGDWENGLLYELSLNAYTDDGVEIIGRRTGSFVSARTYHMLQVDFETGVGLVAGQGEDPKAMLQWSDDGGKTWGAERWADLGKIGEYQRRVRWRRLGSPRLYGLSRVFRVTISDPVRRVITGAMLDASA